MTGSRLGLAKAEVRPDCQGDGSDKRIEKSFGSALTVVAEIGKGLIYGTATVNGMKAHVLEIDMSGGDWDVKPFVSDGRETTLRLAGLHECVAAVNAGYFNMSDGVSASFVTVDGKQVCDPRTNSALVGNPRLGPFLKEIFNRSEIRFCKSAKAPEKVTAVILPHDAPDPEGLITLDAIQGGPVLLPEMDAEAQAFVRKEKDGKIVDSIGTTSKAARTAIGIKGNGELVLVCVAGGKKREFQAGLSLADMAGLMKRLGSVAALNLDGGTSTTMVVKLSNADAKSAGEALKSVCSFEPQRPVKSIIGIKQAK